MRSAPYDDLDTPRGGLPRWALFAAIPLVLALGFVSGIALSTYWPGIPVPAQTSGPGAVAPNHGQITSPSVPPRVPTAQDDSALGVDDLRESPDARRTGSSTALPQAVDEPLPYLTRTPGTITQPGPVTSNNGPDSIYHRAEIRSIVDARAALTTEFGAFRPGGTKAFSVDYQLARDVNYNTVLIGIVKIADYGEWVRAVRDRRAELQVWLKAAAERVKPAATNEKFTLTWTIYEKVSDPPYGFSAKEVTRDPRGDGFVVTRPLAAVTDVARSVVAIASVDTTRPATSDAPWATYGPVIRFDPTDLYRPTSTNP